MKVTGDIVVKMIEHGSFDKPAITGETGSLPRDERMAIQICKVYKIVFETISNLDNNGMDIIHQLYLGENQT
jgi:tetrahydromethanopterin S-methyltransferase subunit A